MKQEILTHLRNHKPHAGSSLADFLRRTKGNKFQREVKDALQSLINEQSIEVPAGMLTQVFEDAHLAQPMARFRNQFDGISITWQGERRWEDVEAKNRDINLNDSLIKTNKFQRRATGWTIVVACLSMVAIGFSAYYSGKGVTAANIDTLTQRIKANSAILESIKQYQKGIDSSLRSIASDTGRRKGR
jgi:hypothetical protein